MSTVQELAARLREAEWVNRLGPAPRWRVVSVDGHRMTVERDDSVPIIQHVLAHNELVDSVHWPTAYDLAWMNDRYRW